MIKFKELLHLKETMQLLENNINSLKKEKNDLDNSIKSLIAQIESLEVQKAQAQEDKNSIMHFVNIYTSLEDCGYEYIQPSNTSSSALEAKLAELEKALGETISTNLAWTCSRQYRVDNSVAKGTKFQNAFAKNMLSGFNVYFEKKCKSITVDNYNDTIRLIKNCYEKFNRQGEMLDITITPMYLTQCLSIIKVKLDIKLAKAEEREKFRQEKAKLKEQEKLLADIAKEREKLAKERRYYEAIYGEATSEEKRHKIKEHLLEIDKREADIDYREKNQKAGWLYIAYTKAMPNCHKLGITRRYDPLIRLQELSSASVPYPFECKGLVFSDDVFTLEANIHNYFEDKRVNKQNRHKEFFFISSEEAITALKEIYHCNVIFVNDEETLDI